ncbi:hydroxypyruvate isomerase [Klebsiella pneumoniae]|nr:hydroxypyruvate isomerase [Klebsiella pneumoniae]
MLRFSANLSMLFQEYDFLDRFEKAAACGFRAVEFMFPYDYAPELLKQKLSDNQLEHTLHNLPAGDWAAGERGIACIPGREVEFREGVDAAIRYAKALGNRKINCLVAKLRWVIAKNIFAQRWWRIYVLPPPRWPRKVSCC